MTTNDLVARASFLLSSPLTDKQSRLIREVLTFAKLAVHTDTIALAKRYEVLRNADSTHTWKAQSIRHQIKELATLKKKVKAVSALAAFNTLPSDIEL